MKAPVALISSTVAPPGLEHYGGNHARFDPAARLEQTRASVRSLLDLGIEEIHLADNSGANWREDMAAALAPARVQVFNHHQYRNKGISELYLLLAALPALPADRPIIKLSGRYRLTRRIDQELGDHDFVVREWRGLSLKHCYISTIAHAVRHAALYEQYLRATLREIFAYPARVVGPRSLLRVARNSLFPRRDAYPYDDPAMSIEHAAWRILHRDGHRVRALESLGIEGLTGQGGTPLAI